MRVIVQKFGGKCVEPGGNETIAAERIMETRDRGSCPVVVVSAMGRELRDWNEELAALLSKPEGARQLALAHFYSTAELVRLVKEIHPVIEPRELDLLMSCGEIISTVRMAHLLKARGYSTMALTGGQVGLITDGYHGNARVIETRIVQLIEALDRPTIPLVTGFQGISPNGHAITTLGEGGSDYTAVCLAYALMHAERSPLQDPITLDSVEIYKEVDGVMTANPAHFTAAQLADGSGPRIIRRLTFDELCAMSRYGADVIQAEAARMARRYGIAVVVRNYRTPDDPGTLIDNTPCTAPATVGVADMPNMTVFRLPDTSERAAQRVREFLEQARLNFHALPDRRGVWTFAVKREKYRDVTDTVRESLCARDLCPDFADGQWALVTLVGEGLRDRVPEAAAEMAETLAGAGVEVEGDIRDTVSVSALVPEPQRTTAILALHRAFISSRVEPTQAAG